jgi:[acyl-carrier-protein] S-malonyltransferase
MTKMAFIFPGQGSQFVGMGRDFEAAQAFEAAGERIKNICFEGPEEDLKQTVNTQPAIVAASLAALEGVDELGLRPDFVAGHSLGEYCAMYAAGVLSLEDTFKLIQARANAMSGVSGGAMAAILNPPGGINEILSQVDGYVDVANYNSQGQIVITGEENAVNKAGELLSAAGAKRVVPLAVSGAFHSKLMQGAADEFAGALAGVTINDASIPVITNVDAMPTTAGADFKEKMPRQIYSSVYWTQSVEYMVSQGVDTFIEIGPGKVLAGLVKKIAPEAKVYNVSDAASLEALKGELCLKK